MHWIFYVLIAICLWVLLTLVIVSKLFFGSLKRQKKKNTGVDTSVLTVSLAPFKDEIKAGLLGEKRRKAYESKINQLKILYPVDMVTF